MLLVNAEYNHLSRRGVSEVSGIINAETVHVVIWIDAIVTVLSECFLILAILLSIALFDYRLALVFVAVCLLAGMAIYFGILRGVAAYGREQTEIRKRQYRRLAAGV